ncbi:FadR/GntR family transcriptional regulator [Paracoccus seriniphilus]|uniref:Transcriptional regulator, GntR family n=1 Tax=Paracoccus seriniphilus TaxID=184748 RepID=A0A239PV88_9RHOB|nr:FadR/GntR family transcriptional regulator [Paracoccus seriniphilus]WCR15538.1 FadR family transcriptional regulator [Paracoccus seriniphilus]SNT74038.1 transcriptional regulator, GntR family [Paracoccus seriniphilus]
MSILDLPGGGRRYLQVAQHLADQITQGTYKAGERLPPERELSQQLDVSRTTIREALLALEIMRFIEIRVGAGVFVLGEHLRDTDGGQLAVKGETGPYEVLEARRLIEGQSAYLAATRATEAQIEEMAAIVKRMEGAIHNVPAFDAADAEFHALIAAASGNSVIEAYAVHLWWMRNSALWSRWYDQTRNPENRRRTIDDHQRIFRALQNRRPEAARTAMQLHIDVLTDRLMELQLSPPDAKQI